MTVRAMRGECRLPCRLVPNPATPNLVLLVRHGATEWSASGRHTGRTDLPLTAQGEDQARRIGPVIESWLGAHEPVVYTSPLQRAARTAALAMPRHRAEPVDALQELDYGTLEGLTTAEILEREPGWDLFSVGCPGGESLMQATARCDSFIAKLERTAAGRAVVAFTHGHLGRLLTTRLLGLPAVAASAMWNDTGSLAAIDTHRGRLVLVGWNVTPQ